MRLLPIRPQPWVSLRGQSGPRLKGPTPSGLLVWPVHGSTLRPYCGGARLWTYGEGLLGEETCVLRRSAVSPRPCTFLMTWVGWHRTPSQRIGRSPPSLRSRPLARTGSSIEYPAELSGEGIPTGTIAPETVAVKAGLVSDQIRAQNKDGDRARNASKQISPQNGGCAKRSKTKWQAPHEGRKSPGHNEWERSPLRFADPLRTLSSG